MWIRAVSRTDRVAKFFRIALSHETLANYIQTNFGLIQHHRWSLAELDSMLPWEREIYVSLLVQFLEEEELQMKQQNNK